VSPALKAKTAAELVAMAKKAPGEINVAVAGTSTGLVGELFSLQTGAKFQSVPYKGAGAATMALLKDEAQVIFLDSANLTPHINSGKLNALLTTGNERSPLLKDVPTAKEAGYASFDVSTWFGVFARAGLPQDVQTQLNAAVREVMVGPKVQEYLKARGATASNMTQSEFATFFHKEVDTWADVIKKADIKAN
jgi:tripartite-type tricarboxylate transporter receptor subunit TctC